MPNPATPLDPFTTAVFGATGAALLSHVPVEVVFGAFAGATLYLLGVKDKPKWQWTILFMLSFLAGLMGAQMIGELLQGAIGLLKIKVSVPKGIGAMVAAALTVNSLSFLRDNPKTLLFWKKEVQS